MEETSFEEAYQSYHRCLEILSSNDATDELLVARVQYNLGVVNLSLAKYEDARSYLEKARDAFTEAPTGNKSDIANCWYSLGSFYLEMKDFDQARHCFKHSLELRQQYLDRNDMELYDSFHSLGACLSDLQKYNEANEYLSEALRIGQFNHVSNVIVLGETHRCLAHVQLQLGDLDSSIGHFEDAIRIRMASLQGSQYVGESEYKKLVACFDAAITMVKSVNDSERLGKLYYKQGLLQSMKKLHKPALKSYTEAVRLYTECLGDNHLTVADALYNVGICLNETNDPNKAIKCLERALRITHNHLGEDHYDNADILQQLAVSYRLNTDTQKALDLCNRVIGLRTNKGDESFAVLLQFNGELVSVLLLYVPLHCVKLIFFTHKSNCSFLLLSKKNCDCQKYEEAERCFRESVRIRKLLRGNENLDVATSLFSLGYVYENYREDYSRALHCYEECLAIRKVKAGKDGMDCSKVYLQLGCCHSALRNEKKALFCFGKSISLCSQQLDENHIIVEKALFNKGQLLHSQGKFHEALGCYEKSLKIRRRILGEKEWQSSEENADAFRYKAMAYEKIGDSDKALSSLNSALEIYRSTVGEDHASTAATLQQLAEHYHGKNENDEALSLAKEALRIRKIILGDTNEDTGDSNYTVGTIYFIWNDYDNALPYFESALAAYSEIRGELHLSVANSLYYIASIHRKFSVYSSKRGPFLSL